MGATPELNDAERDEMFAARMPADLLAGLRALAKENDRSLSAEVRRALRAWLSESAAG